MQKHQPIPSNTAPSLPQTVLQNNALPYSGFMQLQAALEEPNAPLTPGYILQLQKTIGNRGVVQLLDGCTGAADAIGRHLGCDVAHDRFIPTTENRTLSEVADIVAWIREDPDSNYFFRFKSVGGRAVAHEWTVVKLGTTYNLYESDTNPPPAEKIHMLGPRKGETGKGIDEATLTGKLARIKLRVGDGQIAINRVPLGAG